MLQAGDVVTASEPNINFVKYHGNWLVVLALVLILVLLVKLSNSMQKVVLNNRVFSVKVADDDHERTRGLSGTKTLADNQGMLFKFSRPGAYCFWMKDMNYSLDILWLDANKKIVTVYQNITPESYPKSFCPSQEVTTVLEVPGNTINRLGLKVGDFVSF